MKNNDAVPDVKVAVSVAGDAVAIFSFWRVALSPQNWDIVAALVDESTRTAVRACLLACVAEIGSSGWEAIPSIHEGAGSLGDDEGSPQTELPWS